MIAERNIATSSWVDSRHALASKWPVIVLTVSVALLVGSFLGSREAPFYEAVAEVSLLGEDMEETSPRASTELRPSVLNSLRRRESTLRSGVLLLQVIDSCDLVKRWELDDRADALRVLRSRLRIREGEKRGVYRIAVRSASSEESVEIANALALELIAREQSKTRAEAESQVRSFAAEIESRREMVDTIESELKSLGAASRAASSANEAEARDLRRRLVGVSNVIRSLEAKHQRAIVELQSVSSGVEIARKANSEDAELIQQRWQRAGLFSLLGFFVSTGMVLLFSSGRSPFAVLSRISENFQLAVVGIAPVPPLPLPRLNHPPDALLEPYRDLRTKIHRLPAAECSVISLVAESVEGQSSEVAVNLASVLADAGHMVLLIDADVRSSKVGPLLDASRQPGLTDYLQGEMRMEETVIKSRHPNLWCMPSGPMVDDPAGLLGGKRMDDLVWEMKSRFDYILLTSPSIQTHSDAGVLSGYADHAFIVSSYASHTFPRLKKVRYALENTGACVSGVLLAYSSDGSYERSAPSRESESRSQGASHHSMSKPSRSQSQVA